MSTFDISELWFGVSLLFRSTHNDLHDSATLWEEQIVLVRAPSEEIASAKAKCLAKNKEHEYQNAEGQPVKWCFDRIGKVYLIEPQVLDEGVEIFSRFLRDSEVQSLLEPFE